MKCLMQSSMKKRLKLLQKQVYMVPLPSLPTWQVVVPISSLILSLLKQAVLRLSVLKDMKVDVSTTSLEVVQVVRVIRVNQSSIFHLKMTL